MLLVTDDALRVRHRRPLPHAGGRAARARPASTPRIEIGATVGARSASALARPRSRPAHGVGLEAHGVTLGRSSASFADAFDGRELVPTDGLVEELRR